MPKRPQPTIGDSSWFVHDHFGKMALSKWLRAGRRLIALLIFLAWLASVIWLIKPVATLSSLEQVDDYPLYTVRYYGAYDQALSTAKFLQRLFSAHLPNRSRTGAQDAWACSLFAALGDSDHRLYGRNFDWQFSPAVLLFTNPPDGHASVSMVDMAYLGFGRSQLDALTELPLVERGALLSTPYLPFDGMNEHGLVVGMAAVPSSPMPYDPDQETVSSLMAIREVLDHARDVDEAVALLESYNIDMRGGPPLHYLIADASGRAALVEFYQGQMQVFPNQMPWHVATNFLRAAAGDSPRGRCWRYDTIEQGLTKAAGKITPQAAMELLAAVSQPSTQWSVVYGIGAGDVDVTMGRAYGEVHTFQLNLASD